MKTVTRSTSLLAKLGLTAAALLLGQQALAAGTDAGTTVSNQASVVYDVSGNTQTAIESDPAGNSTPGAGGPTEFLVDRRVDFTLTADGVTDTVAPGDTGLTFDFTLTNTGNSTMDFEVTFVQLASTDPAVNALLDTDADVANAVITAFVDNLAEDGVTTVTVTGDAALALIDGDVANIEVTATARDPSGNAGGIVALADTSGSADDPTIVDNVLADAGNDGAESAADGFQVASAALVITKTAVVISDPINGVSANAKAIPGAIVEYTITVDNTAGTSDATGVVISDTIDADVTFLDEAYAVGDDVNINGSFCNADATDTDADGCSLDGADLVIGNVNLAITVAAGATYTITFQVEIPTT
jgi:uncharacterized repeat protein (TIGR01451 family)